MNLQVSQQVVQQVVLKGETPNGLASMGRGDGGYCRFRPFVDAGPDKLLSG